MSPTTKTPGRVPLALWLYVFSAAAAIGGAWYSLKTDVQIQAVQNTQHGLDINDLKTDSRQQREILIRIDENVKELRRERNHP